ncbi:MAG: hypothetical protein LUG13_02920 [Oscillospiraceae bacterium]|nr:hypothetical protein [Oscillospiraceae bacterium]
MQKRLTKSAFSVILTLAMVVSLMSGMASAFAYDEDLADDTYVITDTEAASDAEDATDAEAVSDEEDATDAEAVSDEEDATDAEDMTEEEVDVGAEVDLDTEAPSDEPSSSAASVTTEEDVIYPDTVSATALNTTTDITVTSSGYTISSNGTYHIVAGSTGVITMTSAVTDAVFIGNGAAFDSDGMMTSTPYSNLFFDCSAASGIQLTMQDIYINNTSNYVGGAYRNMINFNGMGNTLIINETCVLDQDTNATNKAALHVARDSGLTIEGDGTLYMYKYEQGAGIGGDSGELNGDITFAMTGEGYIKGSKQGAVIGAGANASSTTDTPGAVTFERGTYNFVGMARGAIIGGSAGSLASAGTDVIVNGGTININVDYSGAAIGGGGYASGNDASGGTVHINGGSLRVYIDTNAANNAGWGAANAGVNDTAITALKVNDGGETVYKCVFDTDVLAGGSNAYSNFSVEVDGALYYDGGLHEYIFRQEGIDKNVEWPTVTSTPSNWVDGDDTCLYFYLTGEDHTITVGDQTFTAVFESEYANTDVEHSAGAFSIVSGGAENPSPEVPTISTQPADGDYTVGDTADALFIEASLSRTGGSLSYQWYSNTSKATTGATAILGATSNSYTPSTSTAGTTYYYCVVTNTVDNQASVATSDFAAVVVRAALTDLDLWTGRAVDFSWYEPHETDYFISTPAQWNALAWIVGGDLTIFDEYATAYGYIVTGEIPEENDNFENATIALTADLDMGAVWTNGVMVASQSAPYLPIGGRYHYEGNNDAVIFDGTFDGSFDGRGHTVYNIYAYHAGYDCVIGLFGEVAGADSVIENVWVDQARFEADSAAGSFAGGIVGRLNGANAIVQGCMNYATMVSSGSYGKGTGGIVGTVWAGQGVYDCCNVGSICSEDKYSAGIVGNLQVGTVQSCFNWGQLDRNLVGVAIAVVNGENTDIVNCLYLYDVSERETPYGVSDTQNNDLTAAYAGKLTTTVYTSFSTRQAANTLAAAALASGGWSTMYKALGTSGGAYYLVPIAFEY